MIRFQISVLFTLVPLILGAQEMINPLPQDQMKQSRFLQDRIDDLPNEVDAYVKKYVDLGIYSGVVLLADRGKVFFQKAYGMADREKSVPNTIASKFNIGSMNKDFTGIVIGQLLEEGGLELTTTVNDVLGGFEQDDADKITIELLLAHKAGIPPFTMFNGQAEDDLWRNPDALLKYLRTAELEYTPGQDQQYSNAGYFILGEIIEKVTGKTYAQNVQERVLDKLDMRDTYFGGDEDIPGRTVGYLLTTTGRVIDNRQWEHNAGAAGGAYSTLEDLLKFYQSYFYDEQLISFETRTKIPLFRMIAEYYDHERAAIPLAGGSNGLNSVICELLGQRISIIVFANMDEPVAEHVGFGILDIVRGDDPTMPSLPAHMNVYKAYKEKGIAYAKSNFEDLTINFHPEDPRDLILNRAGYDLLEEGLLDDAIAIFKLNTELFPKIANCYDSLGEAYYLKGEKEMAKQQYQIALRINPELESSREMLKKLEE